MSVMFQKLTSTVARGQTTGKPVHTRGGRLRLLGFRLDKNSRLQMSSTVIGFEGSFDAAEFFTVNDYSGAEYTLPIRMAHNVLNSNNLGGAPAILPVTQGILFEGIQMLRPVLDIAEGDDREIEFYFEGIS